jgi:hypothetical protein
MSRPRYYVDERIGCVAVRDSNLDNRDAEPGLDEDTTGVVKFWLGKRMTEETCPTCGHCLPKTWDNTQEALDEANKLCRELNEKEEKK